MKKSKDSVHEYKNCIVVFATGDKETECLVSRKGAPLCEGSIEHGLGSHTLRHHKTFDDCTKSDSCAYLSAVLVNLSSHESNNPDPEIRVKISDGTSTVSIDSLDSVRDILMCLHNSTPCEYVGRIMSTTILLGSVEKELRTVEYNADTCVRSSYDSSHLDALDYADSRRWTLVVRNFKVDLQAISEDCSSIDIKRISYHPEKVILANQNIKIYKGETPDTCEYIPSKITYHTHPFSSYVRVGLPIGWPSASDIAVSAYHNDTDLIASLEGIYLVQRRVSILIPTLIKEEVMDAVLSSLLAIETIRDTGKYDIDTYLRSINTLTYGDVATKATTELAPAQIAQFTFTYYIGIDYIPDRYTENSLKFFEHILRTPSLSEARVCRCTLTPWCKVEDYTYKTILYV
jgi:hypothetical protein